MSKGYIDNERFQELIFQYQKDAKSCEDELVEMFNLLIANIIATWRFNVDKEDATQECFLLIFKSIYNFTPEKGKAFNYFTTMIMNHLRGIYTKNKRYEEKILKYQESLGYVPSSV